MELTVSELDKIIVGEMTVQVIIANQMASHQVDLAVTTNLVKSWVFHDPQAGKVIRVGIFLDCHLKRVKRNTSPLGRQAGALI